jgi:putative toxin-antitoxin system antitoxin component (TIGR02293 family)
MSAALFDLSQNSPAVMMRRIRGGLPAESFVEAAEKLGVSQEVLAAKLGLVARTLNRKRKAHEKLSAQESERILRVVRVWNRARSLFRSDEAIAEWLLRPTASLDQAAPLDLLDTDVGTAEVEGLITGLAYGNFQ